MRKHVPFVFVWVFVFCASAAPDLAPMLRERLAKTAALYRDARAWRADIEVTSTIEAEGVTTVATNRFRVLAEKLRRFRIRADENGQRYELLCDGTNVWLYREETHEYLVGE